MVISIVILSITPSDAFSQVTVMDLSCPTCQEISDHKTLALYKEILPLVIWTDSTIFDHNSNVEVIGHSNIQGDIPITMKVTDPTGKLVSINQVTPNVNGDFKTEFNTEGTLWKENGKYIITAQAGDESAGKIFRIPLTILPDVGSDSLIKYDIEGGRVISIEPNTDSNSLTLILDQTEYDGTLTVYLPRNVIDAKIASEEITGLVGSNMPQLHQMNYDDEFVIIMDGNKVSKLNENIAEVEMRKTMPAGFYTEETILDTRILTISFSPGTEKIEIMGSYVVPEFGVIAVLIFMVGLAATLVLSARNGLYQTLKI